MHSVHNGCIFVQRSGEAQLRNARNGFGSRATRRTTVMTSQFVINQACRHKFTLTNKMPSFHKRTRITQYKRASSTTLSTRHLK
jgi:hypothetical protein